MSSAKGPGPDTFGAFPVTRWSLVARAGDIDAEVKRRALAELLQKYMPAMRTYLVCRRRMQVADAEDLLHEFLASKVLDQGIIARAQQERGKFRTFLLTSLDHFMVSRRRFEQAKKRSPGSTAPLEDAEWVASPESPPDSVFDVAWARQVLAESVRLMREETEACSRPDIWGVFEARVLAPAMDGSEPVPYEDLVTRFAFGSPREASNILMTAKRMFVRILRTVVGEYEADEEAIDAEMRELQQILSGDLPGSAAVSD